MPHIYNTVSILVRVMLVSFVKCHPLLAVDQNAL